MIDTFYDLKIFVLISADVDVPELFSTDGAEDTRDELRHLMDDLNLEPESEEAAANVFSGDEEVFAFDRTVSRLMEMQSADYKEKCKGSIK